MELPTQIKKFITGFVAISLLLNPITTFAWTDDPEIPKVQATPITESIPETSPAANGEATAIPSEVPTNTTDSTPADPSTEAVEPAVPETITQNVLGDENNNNDDGEVYINDETGRDSDNEIDYEYNDDNEIETNNEADVVNTIDAIVGTGNNTAQDNHEDASITSGDADIALALLNLINSAFIALPGGEIRFLYKGTDGNLIGDYLIDPKTGSIVNVNNGPYLLNSDTGQSSNNSINGENNSNLDVNNSNLGNLTNTLNLFANTGDNKVADNSGNGSIDTGDIDISMNLLNFLNSTFVVSDFGLFGVVNILGDWTGNLLIPKSIFSGEKTSSQTIEATNNNTGNNSTNQIDSENNSAGEISNNNEADINNIFDLFANTGGNTVSDNSEGGSITTGTVNQLLNFKNFANINMIGDVIYLTFINVLGEWNGKDMIAEFLGLNDADEGGQVGTTLANTDTGNNSDNQISGQNNYSNSVTNSNNGVLNNFINIFANTGGNRVTDNNGSGSLTTGNIKVISNLINFMNVNLYGKKIVFLFVNVFGDWFGNIDFANESQEQNLSPASADNASANEQKVDSSTSAPGRIYKVAGNLLAQGSKAINAENTAKSNESNIAGVTDSHGNDGDGLINFKEPDESTQKFLVDYISNHLNTIFFALFVIYLSFLSVYFKGKKNSIIKN